MPQKFVFLSSPSSSSVERSSFILCSLLLFVVVVVIACVASADTARLRPPSGGGHSDHRPAPTDARSSASSSSASASSSVSATSMARYPTDRSRRSANLYGLWRQEKRLRKFAGIYSVAGDALLEAGRSGKPSTARSPNPNTIVEILFACHMTVSMVGDGGCHGNRSVGNGQGQPIKVFGADDGRRRDVRDRGNHVILIRFRASNQSLCMDSKARLYLANDVESNADCFFWHVHLFNQYDVYYSYTHPRLSPRCRSRSRRSSSRRRRRLAAGGDDAASKETTAPCDRNWHIGVTKHGLPRTFRVAPSDRDHRPKRRILFIQRWTGETRGSSTGGLHQHQQSPLSKATPHDDDVTGNNATAAAERSPWDEGGSRRGAKRWRCSVLLRRCSKARRRRYRRRKAEEEEAQTGVD